MPIERREVLFFFPEVRAALEAARYAPGGELIPTQVNDCAIIEAMHTKNQAYAFHDQRARMLRAIDPALARQSGVVFRANRTGGLSWNKEFGFFVPDPVMCEILVAECGKRRIMLPAGHEKQVVVDMLMVGLRIAIGDGFEVLGKAG